MQRGIKVQGTYYISRTLGCQQFITQVSKVKNVMLPGAELKDLFTRMPKWPKKSKFINLQGCLNRDLFLVLWLLSEIFVSTVFCLKITLFMYQMTFNLNIFIPRDYYNFPNKKKLISMHPIWYKAPPITVHLLYIYCIIGFPSVISVPLQIIQLKLICVT